VAPSSEPDVGLSALPVLRTALWSRRRLFWPKACSFDYLYSDGEILLQNFPVQATINLYEDSDNEEEEEEEEKDKEEEKKEETDERGPEECVRVPGSATHGHSSSSFPAPDMPKLNRSESDWGSV